MLNVTWSFSFNRLESTIAWGKRVLMNGSMNREPLDANFTTYTARYPP